MAIITISRGSFSGGKALAECLAAKLDHRCVDREALVRDATSFGVSEAELHDALERPPSFWDRVKHKRYMYLVLLQAALAEEARLGRIVYHGNAGHLLLRGVVHVLRVRIVAPMEMRVPFLMQSLDLTEAQARAEIERRDQLRTHWTQYLYGVEWRDPALYDIVLNLEAVSVQEACETVASLARQPGFAETDESLASIRNLALASKVRAALLLEESTTELELDVTAKNGSVSLSGKVRDEKQRQTVQEVVRAVPGVKWLHAEGLTRVLDA
jgi:osmotically-inducible protein OsmY